ncbi:hypothetical protein AB0N59_08660 [Microbacterium sp. NPDC089321]|uniref:hypothetical protein n=1 Tax=Microbacterium sp. NPDC089321 TaxID=3155183 RepID=UPI003418B4B8
MWMGKVPLVRRQGDARWVATGLLNRLVGNRLYSVEFVVDYVQLRFDGDGISGGPVVMNCYVWPRVEFRGRWWSETNLGYADALRGLITGTVNTTVEATGVGLRMDLDTGSVILHPALDEVHVEIAELQGFDDGAWMVWRPGEESFEDLV